MLAASRNFAKSWFAKVLMAVLAISFVGWGVTRSGFTHVASNDVITAGSRKISPDDYKRNFDRDKAQAEQQMGQPITTEFAVQNGLDRQVLTDLAANEAFAELMRKAGIVPADSLVAAQIRKIPSFFNQMSGQFDKAAYAATLANNNLTVPKFEQAMRDDIAQGHLTRAMASGLQLPRAYAALAAIYALESRDVAYFAIDPKSVPQPALPTDAQLTQFMKENADRLMRPEFRVLTVVRFSPELAAANAPVDEAAVKKRYDFVKDTLSTPETRTVVQIHAKDMATAQGMAARLTKGEDPAVVAKSSGVDPILYADKPKSAIPDQKAATAAFAMTAGQVQAVQGDLGVSVIKVIAMKPGHQVTLEEARPQLEAQVKKDAATAKVYALSQAYDDARQKGATLAEAAAKAGVSTTTIGPLSQQGRDPQGQPVQGLSQKLVETAFALPQGGESDLVDAGQGEYFAVRAEKVIAPAMPALAEVKPQLTQVWMGQAMMKTLQAKADLLAARVTKGESLDAVAASAGAHVVQLPGLTRQNAQQNKTVSQELMGKALDAKAGDVFTAQAQPFGVLVAKVGAIRPGDTAVIAPASEALRPQMTMALFRELGADARAGAVAEIKVKTNYALARQALGLPALDPKTGKPVPTP